MVTTPALLLFPCWQCFTFLARFAPYKVHQAFDLMYCALTYALQWSLHKCTFTHLSLCFLLHLTIHFLMNYCSSS